MLVFEEERNRGFQSKNGAMETLYQASRALGLLYGIQRAAPSLQTSLRVEQEAGVVLQSGRFQESLRPFRDTPALPPAKLGLRDKVWHEYDTRVRQV